MQKQKNPTLYTYEKLHYYVIDTQPVLHKTKG